MKFLPTSYVGKCLLVAFITTFAFSACEKDQPVNQNSVPITADDNSQGHLKQTKTFSSDVAIRWLNMQLDMLRVPLPAGTGSQGADRCLAYCGIALYESVVPGMPAYQSLCGQLSSLPEMPKTEPGKAYHWAASANAALAEVNRQLFPTTAEINKTNIDNLENTLKAVYATEVDTPTLQRSIAFGKEVASRVLAWAATDGSANVNPPYLPPVGPGLWVPTAMTPPANPYAIQRRGLVAGVSNGTALDPPPVYSDVPDSPFWNMAKDVYDKSLVLTPDQRAMAIYHRDAPGYPGGGHFVAVLSQVLSKANPTLDVAALGYVKVGLAEHEAGRIVFINKYKYNLIRPITYIQNEMKLPTWSPEIPTPNHPEFPSAHAAISMAVAVMLTDVFGEDFHFTLHTYDYLGLPPRSYNSFEEMALEMADSRVYGGIHYQATCDKSTLQGLKVSENILAKVNFKK